MSKERNKKKTDVPELTIFEEQKKAKISAKEVLKVAKQIEAEKLKKGWKYIPSLDGKTKTLTKIK
jgi:hypothetical protein